MDFDASEDQKGPFDRDRKRGPPHPLGFRCIRRHGSFSSMSSCPFLPRNFRGGNILRPLRLDFDASTDTASFASLLLVSPLPRNFRGGKNPRPLRLDFDASTDPARLPACPQGPARPASFRAPGMTPLPGRIRLDFDASEDPKGPLYRSGTETLERPSLAKISWAFSLGIVL